MKEGRNEGKKEGRKEGRYLESFLGAGSGHMMERRPADDD